MARDVKPKDAAWVLRMGRHGVQVLAVVLVLALVFTMVNVQQFAAGAHPVRSFEWWISWLLDPMASITMAAAIVFEGLLADYQKPPVAWLTATKWYAGIATWGMNIWSAVFVEHSLAGVWLHSVAPGIVLGLAEAAPRVRQHMAEIITELEPTPAPVAPVEPGPVDLPAPTYQRVVPPSSWAAPQPPVAARSPQPVASVVETPPVVPVPASMPERVTAVDRHGGERVEEDKPTVDPAPQPVPAEAPGQPEPEPPGHDLDTLIAGILDEADDPRIGRRRITELLPDPKPTDHAVKTALARVRAAKVPALNGSGVPAGSGSTGGSDDG